ncbi:disease resistance protein RPS2-like [Neltuma alba]|uniref:disease resistance protein RPS2-like n=1 Tax=Neltuma alba TaxID=207710 RepID=UPI0010A40E95|nr:disease resistance protein RPS2-like [Prosopis alba]
MTEVIAKIIVPAATRLAQSVIEFLWSKVIGDSISLADIHESLNHGLMQLLALQRDKDNEVLSDIIQKDPSEAYKLWKERVSNIEKQVAPLNKEYVEVGTKRRRIVRRKHLGKNINEALKDVIKLLEECPEKILVDYKLPERVIKETGVLSIAEYPTLLKAFQQILTLLQDENEGVKCVALHGQKGVGKTTIMQNLNNHFFDNDDKLFDMVIFIKVPSDEQIKDLPILQKIANRIKVDREDSEPADVVAGRIREVLENKRYLLILDGLRHTPNGIWEKLDISQHKKDSKVVITTHYPLAFNSKYVAGKVPLERLSPNEAWKMFRCIIGENLLPPIPIARQICERFCYRLPLLIGLIAKSFAYQESPPDWEGLLNECTPWPQLNGFEDLYSVLESGYKLLGDQRKQKCFLYASLYPANSKIYTNYFVECCIAQGFLGDVGASTNYSAMRSRCIHEVLRHLVNVSFLEGDQQMSYVKMNDFYRQFAFDISFKYWDLECSTYRADNEGHEKCSFRPESRQDARWISMVGSKKDCLPTNKNYWSLQTLLLQKNQKLVEIPPTYFDSMSNLLVLNLYGTKIRSLPSLSGLTRLKAFYLNRCSDLTIIPSQIQTLEHLEVFDVRDTGVNFVPCLESLRNYP